MSDFKSFGEAIKFIIMMQKFEVASHFGHF